VLGLIYHMWIPWLSAFQTVADQNNILWLSWPTQRSRLTLSPSSNVIQIKKNFIAHILHKPLYTPPALNPLHLYIFLFYLTKNLSTYLPLTHPIPRHPPLSDPPPIPALQYPQPSSLLPISTIPNSLISPADKGPIGRPSAFDTMIIQ